MSIDTPAKPTAEPMATPAARRLLIMALSAGVVAELLLDRTLRSGEQPGLAFALAAVAAGLMVALGYLPAGRPPSGSARLGSVVLAFFGVMVSLRASTVLAVLNVLVCVGAVLLIAHAYSGPSLKRLSLSGYLHAAFGGVGSAVGGAGSFLTSDLRPSLGRFGRLVPFLRGAALAIIPLVVFTVLFASADAVFADYVGILETLDFGSVIARVVWAVVIAWASLGLMRRAIKGPGVIPPVQGAPRVGVTDAATALVLLNALFVVFVVVQFAYLFGGSDTLAATGLTHAEYARRGFFELVAVAVLVVVLVLSVDWLVQRGTPARRTIDRLHAVLLLLTGVILASALQRMRLYTATFGLTELRLYTTVFMLWVASVLVWMAWTVLRNERDRFPYGSIAAGLVLLAATNLANPDGFIARTNLNHHVVSGRELDTAYLVHSLSADAVPTLVGSLDELDQCTSARLVADLRDRTGTEAGWQSLTWGELTARSALENADLDVISEGC